MLDDVPIAIVGVACRFPGASDVEVFWQNILSDVYSIAPMPPARFNRARYYDSEIGSYGKSYSDLGGLIDEHPFDRQAFRMPPKVQEATDIAHIWGLEVARSAFEHAGWDAFGLRGRNVGVILGHARGSMLSSDIAFATGVEGLLQSIAEAPTIRSLGAAERRALEARVVQTVHGRYPRRTEDGGVGTMTSALAGLISNTFGLTGRHMVVDAACASSLAALDLGVRALRQGKLDAALVGGASYSQEISVIMFAQSRALSPDGSFPFDRRANGFISSDGIGFFVLKRLEDARADGDTVHGVLRGIGSSCDGKGKALWAPRREGQVLAIRRAYETSGVDPSTIEFIEAHATSTPIGDRTEVEALHEWFAPHLLGRKLAIGSVKGNIGHAREAAGAAGLIKALLAVERETVPPTGNLRELSQDIPWDNVAVETIRAPRSWRSTGPRRAGVNAFGIGGLNYHVIVEEAPPKERFFVSAAPASPPASSTSTSASVPSPRGAIAIVGLGGKFPGSGTVESFWDNLRKGTDLTSEVQASRWSKDTYYQTGDRTPYRTYSKRGAFVSDFTIDWKRHHLPPKLIERNDPLQFMLLESAADALEDARIDLSKIDRTRVAVLVGSVFGSDYALELSLAIRSLELAEAVVEALGGPSNGPLLGEILGALRSRLPSINEDSSGSFSSSTLASRTSKTLDLMGPAFSIDAACASSLASLEAACEMLRSNEIDVVLYGGGDRAMRVQRYEAYCQFYALSRTDRCRPFDIQADGFLPGEGAAVLVLKRVEDAERDKDRIYAVVRGIGSSSDGERKSMHKPSPSGLALAMKRALADAGAAPSDVTYIECHGAGTALGDATETEAIRKTYLDAAPRVQPILLGSVKSNVGHAQGAAGAFAVTKTALVLSRREVPPTLHFEQPHPDHRFEAGLRVNAQLEPLLRSTLTPEAAAVSSMGLGGINYHAILSAPSGASTPSECKMQMAFSSAPKIPTDPPEGVFRVRAADGAELMRALQSVRPEELFRLRSVGSGSAVVALAGLGVQDVERGLSVARLTGLDASTDEYRAKQGVFARIHASARDEERICLMFSGQGSQYAGMMRALAREVPEAGSVISRVDAWFEANGLTPISHVMFCGDPIGEDVFLIQASVLAADLMAHEAVRSLGIVPTIVTGHSFGDYAALVAAGVWSIEDALAATRLRAQAIEASTSPGGMMSVGAPSERVESLLKMVQSIGFAVTSNINAPDQTVVSGVPVALEAARRLFETERIETRLLEIPRPYHSELMAPASELLAKSLAPIAMRSPKTRFLSSVTGREEDETAIIRRTLIEQLIHPVHYVGQVSRLLDEGTTVFIECGPRGVLASLTKRIAQGEDVAIAALDDAQRPGRFALARIAALLDARTSANEDARASCEVVDVDLDVAAAVHVDVLPAQAQLTLLEGSEASRLINAEGFSSFWENKRPIIATLVKNLWDAERPPQVQGETESPHEAEAAQNPTPIEHVVDAIHVTDVPSRSAVKEFLIDATCKETGYPAEILTLDADLEADLGIDTVKQAQVLGKVRDRFDVRTDEKLALRDFPTLSHVLEYVDRQLDARRKVGAPKRSRVKIIDVTERRSAQLGDLPAGNNGVAALGVGNVRAGTSDSRVVVLHLSGTSREIGQQHGARLKEPIREVMRRYEAFLEERGGTLLHLPKATASMQELFDPASLEELHGIAEAAGVPPKHLLAYNLDTALFPSFSSGCTQALRLARDNEGLMLHMVNEDSPLLLHLGGVYPRVIQIRQRSDAHEPARSCVFFSLAGQSAGPNGASDHGITVTSTVLLDGPRPEGIPSGVPHPQIVKRILEEARSIDEAVSIVKNAKRAGRWSLLISNADTDEARYLEYNPQEILHDEGIRGRISTTNHAVSGAALGCSVPEHSLHRAERARSLLTHEASLSLDAAKKALRDHHDLGRGRTVTHPTMNTIRRADNVMSLVVEPQRRRLHVTDRVPLPTALSAAGTPELDPVEFMTFDYGRTHPVAREGVGVVECAEIMERHVLRVVEETAPRSEGTSTFSKVVILGRCAKASAIRELLEKRGARVFVEATLGGALSQMESLGGPAQVDAVGIVLPDPSTEPVWLGAEAAWAERRELALGAPFALLRAYAPHRQSTEGQRAGTIFGVSVLGGAFGIENARQGSGADGALFGLLKAVRQEYRSLKVQGLDVSPSEPPELVAKALLAELDLGSPRLEVGLLRGKRLRLAMVPREAHPNEDAAPLPRTWIVTGGARGITARLAQRLAELYTPRLLIFGRHVLPPPQELERLRALDEQGIAALKESILVEMRREGRPFSPLEWKARCELFDKSIEIDNNLRALAAQGSEVSYHAVDLADRAALAQKLHEIPRSGSIGILHGAGVEIAKSLDRKTDSIFESTVGGKVDGLVHLLALTAHEQVTHLVACSSVSGRFGGHGQADYSLANEAMARIVSEWRALHPDRRAAALSWPAFGEVGLAFRSSARTFLETIGQRFMTPAEGANHMVRELWAGLPEPEVTICSNLNTIDLDRLLTTDANRPTWRATEQALRRRPMLGATVLLNERAFVAERSLRASEPFLDQHRMGATPILPAVIALELISEAVAVVRPNCSIRDMEIHRPLKIGQKSSQRVFVRVEADEVQLTSTALRSDGVVLEPARVLVTARIASSRSSPIAFDRRHDAEGELLSYPYADLADDQVGSRVIYHGPVFRCLEGVRLGVHGGSAVLVVSPAELLVPGSRRETWSIPAVLLDGCLQACGMLGRLLYSVVALPKGFTRVDVSTRAISGPWEVETVRLEVRFRSVSSASDELISDFAVFEADAPAGAEPILSAEGYRAQKVPA